MIALTIVGVIALFAVSCTIMFWYDRKIARKDRAT